MIPVKDLIVGEFYINKKDGTILKYVETKLLFNNPNSIVHFYPLVKQHDGFFSFIIETKDGIVPVDELPIVLKELL